MKSNHLFTGALLCALLLAVRPASGQGSAFSYQGHLSSGTNGVNGLYDLTFGLFSVASGAGQVGNTITNTALPVSNGVFTVTLDFGPNFPGASRWLEVSVRTNGSGAFTTLTPRQKILAVPYAMTASNLSGSLPASQLTGTLPQSQLPSYVITNNSQGVNLVGTFIGNGAGLTNLGGFSGPPQNVLPTLDMIWIPPGSFVLGSPITQLDRNGDEGPQTAVVLTRGLFVAHHPVTQGEYLVRLGVNPSSFSDDISRPVEDVSWIDATNYCALLTTAERTAGRIPSGWAYRLPTEAEWEYLARAWTTARFYYGDDLTYANLNQYAWYSGNSSNQTHGVAQKLPNEFGLADMAGNVWEWCQDWYATTYPGGAATDPKGPLTGTLRVVRGGSFTAPASSCRVAQRNRFAPGTKQFDIGFRVVLAPL